MKVGEEGWKPLASLAGCQFAVPTVLMTTFDVIT